MESSRVGSGTQILGFPLSSLSGCVTVLFSVFPSAGDDGSY
jgi:hypothetical protein